MTDRSGDAGLPGEPSADPGSASEDPTTSASEIPLAPPLVPAAVAPLSDADAPIVAGQSLPPPAGPLVPPVVSPTPITPPLVPTRALLGAAFDLLLRSGPEMRRASFYVGAIVLGTVGPVVLATLFFGTGGFLFDPQPFDDLGASESAIAIVYAILVTIAFVGLLVAIFEARNLGIAVLGGQFVDRPLSTSRALTRSRRAFWATVGAALLVGIPVGIAQFVTTAIIGEADETGEVSTVVSTLVGALVGAPFAYTLTGVVLGDVGPIEALRRSFRIFGVRRAAAFLVVLFESVALLLVILGLGAGLDLVIRAFDAVGLSPEAGGIGLVLTAVVAAAIVFASGTLLFTVYALTVAPQVVMFVGLTHATFGLDRVRPGGRDDPNRPGSGAPRFRWFSAGMILAFVVAGAGLVFAVWTSIA